jgi:hypothetical protein
MFDEWIIVIDKIKAKRENGTINDITVKFVILGE